MPVQEFLMNAVFGFDIHYHKKATHAIIQMNPNLDNTKSCLRNSDHKVLDPNIFVHRAGGPGTFSFIGIGTYLCNIFRVWAHNMQIVVRKLSAH